MTPGNYEVQQVVQSGWTQTAPTQPPGYVWSDSNDAGGPAYNWFDISGLGTSVSLADDDSVSVALPFSFDFYGQSETNVTISSNGYLTFGIDGTDYTNDPIPSATDPNAIIAPFWDDLNPLNGGNIYHYDDAANSRFIVQYDGIMRYSGAGNYTFQAILNADGSIEYQYNSMSGILTSATIGIENHAGNDGLTVSYNTSYAQNGLAVLIEDGSGQPTFNAVTVSSGQAVTGVDFGNHNPVQNAQPVAQDDQFDVNEDAALAGDLFANNGSGADSDPEGGALSISQINGVNVTDGQVVNLASGALLTINADGTFSYDQNGAFASLNDGQTGNDGFTYTVIDDQNAPDQGQVSIDIAGSGGVDPSPGNDNFVGTGANNTFNGYGGNDDFLLRWGSDTATGGTGADDFIIDGRYINDGDSHRITDLNFAEGDQLKFRFMDAGTFDNAVDPANQLFVYDNGAKAHFNSIEDIVEAVGNGVMIASDAGDGDTLLTVSRGGNQLQVELDGIAYASLNIGGNAPPVARDDSFNVVEDVVLAGDLLADNGSGIDFDPEAGALSIVEINGGAVTDGQVVNLGSGALLTINADGTFSYNQNDAFDALNDGDTGNDGFTYTLEDDQGETAQATVSIAIAGTGGPIDPSPGNDNFVGTGADNIFNGHGGDDDFLLRWGDDTAIGGTGADAFTIDGRYVNDGDDHRIVDLNFSEGDVIDFRFMDTGTFDNNVDPSNHLFVYDNGAKSQFNSVADILEAHNNGVMTAADDGFGGTILSVSVGGDQLTITLDGWDII